MGNRKEIKTLRSDFRPHYIRCICGSLLRRFLRTEAARDEYHRPFSFNAKIRGNRRGDRHKKRGNSNLELAEFANRHFPN